MQTPKNSAPTTTTTSTGPNSSNRALNEMPPAKDVNDFRYHRLERENQYSELQVTNYSNLTLKLNKRIKFLQCIRISEIIFHLFKG